MLRKDPLIKKLILNMVIGLTFILSVAILIIYNLNIKYQTNLLLTLIIASLLIIFMNIWIFMKIIKRVIKRLEEVSHIIDKTMDGEEISEFDFEEEGIFSRIGSQLSQMTRRLNKSLSLLDNEKESVKSLVTDISHQIKTPLASIKLFNTLLLEDNISLDEKQEFLEKTKEEIDKLEWLSSSLIKVSRMEIGMIELNKENINIYETLKEAINSVYLNALEKKIDICVVKIVDLDINHDKKWTKEALVNVLENAIKYSDTGTEIKITIEKLETYVKIDIEDNGLGITNDEIGKVFNRFFRGNREVIKNSDGSGIGLYLTRKILEEQGGNIIVTSKEGEGAKFSIFLSI